jgi:hypothetical protein
MNTVLFVHEILNISSPEICFVVDGLVSVQAPCGDAVGVADWSFAMGHWLQLRHQRRLLAARHSLHYRQTRDPVSQAQRNVLAASERRRRSCFQDRLFGQQDSGDLALGARGRRVVALVVFGAGCALSHGGRSGKRAVVLSTAAHLELALRVSSQSFVKLFFFFLSFCSGTCWRFSGRCSSRRVCWA